MSIFLQEQINADAIILPKKIFRRIHADQKSISTQNGIDEMIQSELKKLKEIDMISQYTFRDTKQFKQYSLLAIELLQSYKILMKVVYHKKIANMVTKFDLLTREDVYLKIKNKNSIVQNYRNIEQMLNFYQICLLKISINISTGAFRIHLPILNTGIFNNSFPKTSEPKIRTIYINYFKFFCPILKDIVANINKQSLMTSKQTAKVQNLEKIYKHHHMINIDYNFTNDYNIDSEHTLLEKQSKKKNDIQRVFKHLEKVDKDITRSIGLVDYRLDLGNCIPKKKKDYTLPQEQLRYIITLTAMPVQPKNKNPYENSLILNHIFIHNDMNKLQTYQINKGGFSQIHLTTISFSYIYSSQGHQLLHKCSIDNQNLKSIIQKMLIFKRDLKERKSSQRKNQHELSIIKKIKSGNSIFLPKYYIPINKDNPFADDILIDFVPFKSLRQYLESNQISISLLTKLYLIFSVVQSLRYIKDYEIVHLDLKPNNIMIFCNLLIKLIDFGESFHPEVCKQKHKPGYTLPYCPPQIFSDQKVFFTSKSDVYSLGIIIYQILYRTYPFDIYQRGTKVDTLMQKQNYLNKWYFTPQEYEQSGDIKVMRILNSIISRCLQRQPQNRPQLDWISVIVRQCFQLLY